MSETYGPRPPTRAEVAQATWRTAAVNADPSASMADRLAAAQAEAAAIIAHPEGAHADLEVEL
jgi:hypothetical protein